MKMVLRGLVIAAMTLTLAGCDCDGEGYVSDCLLTYAGEPDEARVQFLNQMTEPAADDAAAVEVDLFTGVESDALFSARGYTTTSIGGVAAVKLDGQSQRVSFDTRSSANDLTLVSGRSVELIRETRYAAVAMGTLDRVDSYDLRIYPNEDQDPPRNRASIRFVNTLSESTQPLRLVLPGGTELASLAYGDDSGYLQVNPDNGEIRLDLVGAGGVTVASVSCAVTEERTYLAILGYAAFDSVDDDAIRLFCHRR